MNGEIEMNAMGNAFEKIGVKRPPVSPSNPSRRAIARVTNPLPVPTCCPNCGDRVGLVSNKVIYGREYGEWPWAYRCNNSKCDSYVGLHPFTNIPLGKLANPATREARKQAKAAFNPLWERGTMDRTVAYKWLAYQLGIENFEECHIGWFGVAMCERVIDVCSKMDHS
jgi:zinc-finger-containing domain